MIIKTQFNLHDNWRFLLMSQVARGVWFIEPQIAIGNAKAVHDIFNRDWDGFDQTDDLNRKRAELPVALIGPSGSVHAGSGQLDKAPSGSVAIIPLKGSMLKYGTLCSYGTEEIAAAMLDAGSHKNVSSVILDIDTGGGAVDAVAPMIEAINKIRNYFGKPVVANADLCASAGMWVASACNKIVANNNISAHFGSIGVMCSFADVRPMYKEKGYVIHEIYSTHSEWKNKSFLLALEGKYDLIKSEDLDPLAVQFQNTIKQNRPGLKTDTEGIISGRMFYANDAKKYGLIDEIGNMDTSIRIANDLIKKTAIENYTKS